MAKPQRLSVAPAPKIHERTQKRHLAPVTQSAPLTSKQGTLALVIIAIATVLGIFATQLWLSVAISEGAYATNDLILEERELMRTERVMEQEVFLYSSPQNLSQQASGQGMVQNAQPAFLALSGASIQGELAQRSSEARANTVPNAALTDFTTPVAEKRKAEREATRAAAAEKKAEAEKMEEAVASQPMKPSGPVAWSGTLPAPATH